MMGERIPTQISETYFKDNGTMGTRVYQDYAVLLTEKDGSDVTAFRYRTLAKKGQSEFMKGIEAAYPGYNIKGAWRLYDDDFMK